MTKEDKELLLKDLCARLFYNPWVQFTLAYGDNKHKEGIFKAHISTIDFTGWLEVDYLENEDKEREWSGTIEDIKPYLRPISSMTENELQELWITHCSNEDIDVLREEIRNNFPIWSGVMSLIHMYDVLDWMNKHHFDYRGLIEKGLAFEALEGMYNLEKK